MQVNGVNTQQNSYKPNFKALKGIKFQDVIEDNYKVQNELLRIFDHQPIKDIFTKFDGKVEFKTDIYALSEQQAMRLDLDLNNLHTDYQIDCNMTLQNQNLPKWLQRFKNLANDEGVNINKPLNDYKEKFEFSNFVLEKAVYRRKQNFDINITKEQIDGINDGIRDAQLKIGKIKGGTYLRSEWDNRDVNYFETVIKDYELEKEPLEAELSFYNDNAKDWGNPFILAAKNLVKNVLRMDSEKVDKKISEVIKSEISIENDLDEILQEEIITKNVKNKLKSLLGDNYVEKTKTTDSGNELANKAKKSATELDEELDESEIIAKTPVKKSTKKGKSKKTNSTEK